LSTQGVLFLGSALLSVGIGAWLMGRERRLGDHARSRILLDGPEAAVWLVAGLLVWLASMVGASIVAAMPADWVGLPDTARRNGLTHAGAYGLAITVGVLILIMLRPRLPENGRDAGMRVRWGDLYYGVLSLVLVAPFYLVVSQLSQMASRWVMREAPSTIKHQTLQMVADGPRDIWWWAMIAGAAVGAPLVEELVYRVFLQSAALKATKGAGRGWVAVIATSAVWAPIHLIGGAVPVSAVPSLFVLGVGIGIAYERTRRLGVPIVMHVLFNTINLLAVTLGWVG
jgi:membrane protease YdiL (CAAX protease family)